MRCPVCAAETVADAAFCRRCGATLAKPGEALGARDQDDRRIAVSFSTRQVLSYGLGSSLALFAFALVMMLVPRFHLGPGIGPVAELVAWVSIVLGVLVQVGAAATAIRMLGGGRWCARADAGDSRVARESIPEAPGNRLLDAPPSVVEHTTFRLTVPASVERAPTTGELG